MTKEDAYEILNILKQRVGLLIDCVEEIVHSTVEDGTIEQYNLDTLMDKIEKDMPDEMDDSNPFERFR